MSTFTSGAFTPRASTSGAFTPRASTPGASTPGASRAAWIACLAALSCAPSSVSAPAPDASTPGASMQPAYAAVLPGHSLQFPADYGSHPDFRTEWWYVTGWLETRGGEPLGFQITFFRTRPAIDEANPSAFAPHQLLIAHCALSDPKRGRLWQDQSIRRAGLGLAQAAVGDTNVALDRWTLKREAGAYLAAIDADGFALHLNLATTQAPLLNGDSGVSRKGVGVEAASYYYSVPHLRLRARSQRERPASTR